MPSDPRHCLKHGGWRVLVTGGRFYDDRETVFRILDKIARKYGIVAIIHGWCHVFDPKTGKYVPSGADRWADEWATERGVPCGRYPVLRSEWKEFGPAAGPMRNGKMISKGQPDLCVRFPGDRGTADCARQCNEKGILVWDVATNEVT